MVRTQIYLTESEKAQLARLAGCTGKSQSEIIREALDQFAERCIPQDRRACLQKARGIWRDRSDLPDLRALREESDRSAQRA